MFLPLAVSTTAIGAIIGAGVAAYFALLIGVSMFEKRPLRAHGPLDEDYDIERAHPYVRRMTAQAAELGLEPGGWTRHGKHDIIGSVWLTPDRMMLVHTGAGRVAGMEAKQTWVYTWLSDGRILVTTDNFDEGDPSGLYIVKRRLKGDVPKLIEVQRARLESGKYSPMLFSDAPALESLNEIGEKRVERLLEIGRARWRDPEQTTWSYSLRGSLWVAVDFFRQFAQGLFQFWRV